MGRGPTVREDVAPCGGAEGRAQCEQRVVFGCVLGEQAGEWCGGAWERPRACALLRKARLSLQEVGPSWGLAPNRQGAMGSPPSLSVPHLQADA